MKTEFVTTSAATSPGRSIGSHEEPVRAIRPRHRTYPEGRRQRREQPADGMQGSSNQQRDSHDSGDHRGEWRTGCRTPRPGGGRDGRRR